MVFHLTERKHSVTKAYSFKKGDVTLAFSLSLDKKGELIDFKALMADAIEEIEADIKRYENSK